MLTGWAALDSAVRTPALKRPEGFLRALVTGWKYFEMVAMFLHRLSALRMELWSSREPVRWRHAALVCNELAELKTDS